MRKPMRVCMVAYTYYESDNRVIRYARALARRGDDVEALVLQFHSAPSVPEMDGVRLSCVQSRTEREKRQIDFLVRHLMFFFRVMFILIWRSLRRRYDVIHCHSVPDFIVFAAWFPKLLGTRLILDIHDIVPEFFLSKFGKSKESRLYRALKVVEKLSAWFADHVIIANDLWREVIVRRSAPAEKVSVYLNYPESDIFHPRERRRRDDRFIAMYPGSLNWHQGLDVAIRAFGLIKEQAPEAEFHIYGGGGEEPALRRLIDELGLQQTVRMMGSRTMEEIAEVVAEADLGIVPKRSDSFGNEAFSTKILEFMSEGVPVLAADTRIDQFYFRPEVIRFFRSGDERNLADELLALIRNPEERWRLAQAGLAYAGELSWDRHRTRYFALVDGLAGLAPAAAPAASSSGGMMNGESEA